MSFESLLISTGNLIRKGADTYEYGTPTPGAATVVLTFPCRFQQGLGKERVAVSDARALERWGTVFTTVEIGEQVLRSDQIEIEGVGTFEVQNPKLVYDGQGPHHYEISVERVSGA